MVSGISRETCHSRPFRVGPLDGKSTTLLVQSANRGGRTNGVQRCGHGGLPGTRARTMPRLQLRAWLDTRPSAGAADLIGLFARDSDGGAAGSAQLVGHLRLAGGSTSMPIARGRRSLAAPQNEATRSRRLASVGSFMHAPPTDVQLWVGTAIDYGHVPATEPSTPVRWGARSP